MRRAAVGLAAGLAAGAGRGRFWANAVETVIAKATMNKSSLLMMVDY
jgi:hypothetical protein